LVGRVQTCQILSARHRIGLSLPDHVTEFLHLLLEVLELLLSLSMLLFASCTSIRSAKDLVIQAEWGSTKHKHKPLRYSPRCSMNRSSANRVMSNPTGIYDPNDDSSMLAPTNRRFILYSSTKRMTCVCVASPLILRLSLTHVWSLVYLLIHNLLDMYPITIMSSFGENINMITLRILWLKCYNSIFVHV
jgi:hypothetical protein